MDYPVCGLDSFNSAITHSGFVYVNGSIKGLSADSNPISPICIGRVSDDSRVRGGDGLIVGKITPTGHFISPWW
jgi:hypothetical protein